MERRYLRGSSTESLVVVNQDPFVGATVSKTRRYTPHGLDVQRIFCNTGVLRIEPKDSPLYESSHGQRRLTYAALAVTGLSNAEIAEVLEVKEDTVKTGVSSVRSELATRSRSAIAGILYEHGALVEERRGQPLRLDPLEKTIVSLVDQGLPDVQIGERLGVSRTTAKDRLGEIMVRTGYHRREQLALGARVGHEIDEVPELALLDTTEVRPYYHLYELSAR